MNADKHIEEGTQLAPAWSKRGGLLPVVVQEAATGRVLMLGYANEEALAATQQKGYATFFSTSRQTLWTKGETSGNRLRLVEVRIDCDQDALLYLVELEGTGACHTHRTDGTARTSCFYRTLSPDGLTFLPEEL